MAFDYSNIDIDEAPAEDAFVENPYANLGDPPAALDRKPWTKYEPTFFGRLGAEWQNYDYIIERGSLGRKAMLGTLTPEDQRKLDWIEAHPPPEIPNAPGPLDDFIGPGFGMINLLVTGIAPKALAGAGVGAVAGGAAGLAGGPFAGATAALGAGLGAKSGAAWAMFELEGGNAYLDNRRMAREVKAKTGEEIPESAIVGASIATGAVNAALEGLSLGVLARAPGIRVLTRRLNQGGVQRLLRNPSTRNRLAELGKSYAKVGATEGTTEGLQESVTMGFGELIRRANVEGTTGRIGWDEALDQIIHSVQQGALAGGGLAVAGGVPSTALDIATPVRAYARDLKQLADAARVQAEKEGLNEVDQQHAAHDAVAEFLPKLHEMQEGAKARVKEAEDLNKATEKETEKREKAQAKADEILAPEPTLDEAQAEVTAARTSLKALQDAEATANELDAGIKRVVDADAALKKATSTAAAEETAAAEQAEAADAARLEREKAALAEAGVTEPKEAKPAKPKKPPKPKLLTPEEKTAAEAALAALSTELETLKAAKEAGEISDEDAKRLGVLPMAIGRARRKIEAHELAATKPEEAKPAEAKPAEAKPAEAKPEPRPIASKTTAPGEITPEDVRRVYDEEVKGAKDRAGALQLVTRKHGKEMGTRIAQVLNGDRSRMAPAAKPAKEGGPTEREIQYTQLAGTTSVRTAQRIDKRKDTPWDDDIDGGIIENIREKKGKAAAALAERIRRADVAALEAPEFAEAGETVSGLRVREDIPNQDSIAASLTDYEILPGVREVRMDQFDPNYQPETTADVKELAEQIEESGEINPLIVVQDAKGLYILEGGHRYDALKMRGATSLPAIVVRDLSETKADPAIDTPVDEAAHEAATSPLNGKPEPTDAQIEKDSYEKGALPIGFGGKQILIENPEGSTRSSKKGAKKKWSQVLRHHYGYIEGTRGADGDPIDAFVKPGMTNLDVATIENVFVIDQIDQETGEFDEHKVMVGFKNAAEAKKAYAQNYEKGWKIGRSTKMSAIQFDVWLREQAAGVVRPAHAKTPYNPTVQQAQKKRAEIKAKRDRKKTQLEEVFDAQGIEAEPKAKPAKAKPMTKQEKEKADLLAGARSLTKAAIQNAEQQVAKWEASLAEITPGPHAADDTKKAKTALKVAKARLQRLRESNVLEDAPAAKASYEDAVAAVRKSGHATTTVLQKLPGVGQAQATVYLKRMETEGIITVERSRDGKPNKRTVVQEIEGVDWEEPSRKLKSLKLALRQQHGVEAEQGVDRSREIAELERQISALEKPKPKPAAKAKPEVVESELSKSFPEWKKLTVGELRALAEERGWASDWGGNVGAMDKPMILRAIKRKIDAEQKRAAVQAKKATKSKPKLKKKPPVPEEGVVVKPPPSAATPTGAAAATAEQYTELEKLTNKLATKRIRNRVGEAWDEDVDGALIRGIKKQFTEKAANLARTIRMRDSAAIDPLDISEARVRTPPEQMSLAGPVGEFFYRWFGDSKIVDENGDPLVVYHAGYFNEEDNEAMDTSGIGAHFGTAEAADERMGGKGVDDFVGDGRVYESEGRWWWEAEGMESFDVNEKGFATREEAQTNLEQTAVSVGEHAEQEFSEHTVTQAYLNLQNPLRIKDLGMWSLTDVVGHLIYRHTVLTEAQGREIHAAEKQNSTGFKVLKKLLTDQGIDGLVYRNQVEDKGSDSYVAFSSTQIKSVNNIGSYSLENPIIREARSTSRGLALTPKQAAAQRSRWEAIAARVDAQRAQGLDGPTVRLVPTSELAVGLTRVFTPQDVAHVVASFRKDAQENFLFVVANKRGNVLGVVAHSRGTSTQSLVNPLEALGPIFGDMPGAAKIWMVHNHPAGFPTPSREDIQVQRRLQHVIEGSGIELKGSLVLGHGDTNFFITPEVAATTEGGTLNAVPVRTTPLPRRKRVQVLTRKIRRVVNTGANPEIRGPGDLIRALVGIEGTGLLFTNVRMRPIGWLPLSIEEMQTLRTGDPSAGLGKILAEASRRGAKAMLMRTDNVLGQDVDNMAGFGSAANLPLLDVIDMDGNTLTGSGGSIPQVHIFEARARRYQDLGTKPQEEQQDQRAIERRAAVRLVSAFGYKLRDVLSGDMNTFSTFVQQAIRAVRYRDPATGEFVVHQSGDIVAKSSTYHYQLAADVNKRFGGDGIPEILDEGGYQLDNGITVEEGFVLPNGSYMDRVHFEVTLNLLHRSQGLGMLRAQVRKPAHEVAADVTGSARLIGRMTPEESEHLTVDVIEKVLELVKGMSHRVEEMAAAAWAGRAKKGWYRDSAEAIVNIFGAEDAPRFAGLLAALSPQTSVEIDTENALKVWTAWVNADRLADVPKDRLPHAIKRLMRENLPNTPLESLSRKALLERVDRVEREFEWGPGRPITISRRGSKETIAARVRDALTPAQLRELSILPAWINNTIRVLSASNEDVASIQLSGAKVDSFMRNLRGEVEYVTNDTYMAIMHEVTGNAMGASRYFKGKANPFQDRFGYIGVAGKNYLAANDITRQAAEYLTEATGTPWSPAEVQETVWSWVKALTEQLNSAEEKRSALGIIKSVAGVDQKRILETPDFAVLLAGQTYLDILDRVDNPQERDIGQIAREVAAENRKEARGRNAARLKEERRASIGIPTRLFAKRLAAVAERVQGKSKFKQQGKPGVRKAIQGRMSHLIENLREGSDMSLSEFVELVGHMLSGDEADQRRTVVQAVVDTVRDVLPGMPEIIVVKDPSMYPPRIQQHFAEKGDAEMTPAFITWNNAPHPQIWINADAMSYRDEPISSIVSAVFHEGVGHFGIRNLFPDEGKLNRMFMEVYEQHRDSVLMREVVEIYMKKSKRDPIAFRTQADKLKLADEYVAHLAGAGDPTGILKRIVFHVRQLLRKSGLVKGWTNNDIMGLLRLSAEALGEGKPLSEARDVEFDGEVVTAQAALQLIDEKIEEAKASRAILSDRVMTEEEVQAQVPFENAVVSLESERAKLIEFLRRDGVNVGEIQGGGISFTKLTDPGGWSASRIRTNELGNPAYARKNRRSERMNRKMRLRRQRARARDIKAQMADVDIQLDQRLEEMQEEQRNNPRDLRIRFALSRDQADAIDEDPTSPEHQYDKFGAVLHDSHRQKERGLDRVRRIISDIVEGTSDAARTATLAGAPARFLGEFIRKSADGVDSVMEQAFETYLLHSDRMGATFSKFVNEYTAKLDDWIKFQRALPDSAGMMHVIMHTATLARTDPSMDYVAEFNVGRLRGQAEGIRSRLDGMDAENREAAERDIASIENVIAREQGRRSDYDQMKDAFYDLPDEGQRIYKMIRDQYKTMHDQLAEALHDKIVALSTAAGQPVSSAALDKIKEVFEQNTIGNPYFPLARFGNFYAVAKNADGEVMAYSQFEHRMDGKRAEWKAEHEAQGFVVTLGTQAKYRHNPAGMAQAVDTNFARDVMTQFIDFTPEGVAHPKFPGADRIADDIWQMYLTRLPEFSARKASLHRKGTTGFTADAMRAYAHHAFVTARSLSKTIHGHDIDAALKAVHDGAEKLDADTHGKATWAVPIADELSERHKWQMNPEAQPISTTLTKMGFHAFLGFNMSSAAVNLTQSWIVGLPILGAKYGIGAAGKALSIATNDMRHKEENWGNYLSADELTAMQALEEMGVFEKTRAYELRGMGDSGEAYLGNWTRAEAASAFMFSKAESFNRKLTALATYRLARAAGESAELAQRTAWKTTWDTHFDYSNANRPRVMQGSIGRVALLFRNYAFNMAYRLGTDFASTIHVKEMSPEQRTAAKKRFAGMLGATFLVAGVRGLPLVGIVGAALASSWALGDDDDPIDIWDSTRQYLSEVIGPRGAGVVLEGPVSALTNVDVSNRLSLSNLFFRDPPPELKGMLTPEWMAHWAGEATGPLGAYAVSISRGVTTIVRNESDEKMWRGIELMLPLQARNMSKSLRYMLEDGVKSWHGQDVMPKGESVATWSKMMQAAGFSPYDLNLRYEEVGAIYGIEQSLLDRRQLLIGRKRDALIDKDRRRARNASEGIRQWNRTQIKQKRPKFRITMGDVNRSRRSKIRANREYLGPRRFTERGRQLARQRGLEQ